MIMATTKLAVSTCHIAHDLIATEELVYFRSLYSIAVPRSAIKFLPFNQSGCLTIKLSLFAPVKTKCLLCLYR